MADKRDWTGYTIVIPEQHSIIIVAPWRKERPDTWWWKCCDCTKSSGMLTTIQLEKFDAKGMIEKPSDERKMPYDYSGHPREAYYTCDEEDYYGYGYGSM